MLAHAAYVASGYTIQHGRTCIGGMMLDFYKEEKRAITLQSILSCLLSIGILYASHSILWMYEFSDYTPAYSRYPSKFGCYVYLACIFLVILLIIMGLLIRNLYMYGNDFLFLVSLVHLFLLLCVGMVFLQLRTYVQESRMEQIISVSVMLHNIEQSSVCMFFPCICIL